MKKERICTLFAFTVLIAVCSYPLFINLGKLSLRMWDESRNAINAFEMMKDHSFIVTHFDGQPDTWNSKPPFMIWCIALCMKLFGATTFAVRLPSALATLAAVVLLFGMSKKYLSNVLPGFLAALVLCSSVGFIDYHVARNGDFDAMLSVWMFFYALFFFLYLEVKERKKLVWSAVFLALAILTKGIAACMILPALLFFVFTGKEYRSVLKKPEFYIIPSLGLLAGLSYYLIREGLNAGYIKAVIENEITGRYMATNEGHTGSFFYYLQLMNEAHYRIWLRVLPFAFIAVFFSKEKREKQLSIFSMFVCVCYLLIISCAQTKLPWYDAPLYPFMALIIGIGAKTVYAILLSYTPLKAFPERTIGFCFFCLLLFYYPSKNILASSLRAKKETYYPELFYGDFISSFHKKFPAAGLLTVVSEGYNPHLIFYTKTYRDKGLSITVVPRNAAFKINDTVMVCEPDKMWPVSGITRYADTIYSEDNNKFVLKINDPGQKETQMAASEKLFYGQIDDIKANEEWMKDILGKAAKKGNDPEKQVQLDALYKLETGKLLSKGAADSLRIKFRLTESQPAAPQQ